MVFLQCDDSLSWTQVHPFGCRFLFMLGAESLLYSETLIRMLNSFGLGCENRGVGLVERSRSIVGFCVGAFYTVCKYTHVVFWHRRLFS